MKSTRRSIDPKSVLIFFNPGPRAKKMIVLRYAVRSIDPNTIGIIFFSNAFALLKERKNKESRFLCKRLSLFHVLSVEILSCAISTPYLSVFCCKVAA